MSQTTIRFRTIILMAAAGIAAVGTAGCSYSRELESLKQKNQAITDRVNTLESQLNQTTVQSAADTTATTVQELKGQTLYIVVDGDTLWNIAKKRLGSGPRYKEILALNPHIKQDDPLTIGTLLKLPPTQL